ncbi:dehydrodolichyl diphosphate synthase complex subunit nus1-like [Liolophura sinensis]|uniref:dehydrodolichyl diphosphate synthase complex subunit nus1-like n=1 Tax=Liolophura sinensis TaxID=3198878 RepID=UPI0031596A0F
MFLDRHLLRLTHCILDFGSFLCQFTVVIWSMAMNFVLYRKRKEMCYMPESATEGNVLRKLPQHIAYIVTESKFSYKDLANLIIWAVEFGISYVTVYDPHGEIKRNNKILKDLIQQKNIRADSSGRFDIQISTDLQECKASMKVFNVAVLSLEDGRQGLVRLTKQLSSQVLANQWSIADVVPNSVNKLIQESYGFPDPDLIVRFGNISSLIGFLPWHVRLSEILSLPTHHGLDYYLFRCTLMRYGCLEQRFGK